MEIQTKTMSAEKLAIVKNQALENMKEWRNQYDTKTKENEYENVSEFEAFINKWMDKGLNESEARVRAMLYAASGLLDYGNQKVVQMPVPLSYGDEKKHGMHLIDNDILKQSLKETFNSLDGYQLGHLVHKLFITDKSYTLDENQQREDVFQSLLKEFGLTLKDIEPEKKVGDIIVFDKNGNVVEFEGDINVNEQTSPELRNFIFDNIFKFLKYHMKDIEANEKNFDNDYNKLMGAFDLLIENLEKNINLGEEKIKENNALLKEYTKNSRPNPLDVQADLDVNIRLINDEPMTKFKIYSFNSNKNSNH